MKKLKKGVGTLLKLKKVFFPSVIYRDIGPAVRVFANGSGDLGSIPGRVIPKTLKMELDTTFRLYIFFGRPHTFSSGI